MHQLLAATAIQPLVSSLSVQDPLMMMSYTVDSHYNQSSQTINTNDGSSFTSNSAKVCNKSECKIWNQISIEHLSVSFLLRKNERKVESKEELTLVLRVSISKIRSLSILLRPVALLLKSWSLNAHLCKFINELWEWIQTLSCNR